MICGRAWRKRFATFDGGEEKRNVDGFDKKLVTQHPCGRESTSKARLPSLDFLAHIRKVPPLSRKMSLLTFWRFSVFGLQLWEEGLHWYWFQSC